MSERGRVGGSRIYNITPPIGYIPTSPTLHPLLRTYTTTLQGIYGAVLLQAAPSPRPVVRTCIF